MVTLRIKPRYVLFYLGVWCISWIRYYHVILAHSYAMEMRHLRETSGIGKVQPGDIERFLLKNLLKLWTPESKYCIGPPILKNTRMNAP